MLKICQLIKLSTIFNVVLLSAACSVMDREILIYPELGKQVTVTAKVDQPIVIKLPMIEGTGYEWNFSGETSLPVTKVDSPKKLSDRSFQYFKTTSGTTGDFVLNFEYKRRWELQPKSQAQLLVTIK